MNDGNIGYQSQWGQDRFVDEVVFRGRTGGVFVEIGAHDGVTLSNSYALEKKRGWSGLLVEPLPARAEECRKRRTATVVQGCVTRTAGTQTFTFVEGSDQLSGLGEFFPSGHRERIAHEPGSGKVRQLAVDCFTFGDLMRRHGIERIDYCSIDTEGAELDILESIDFASFRPTCLSVEANGNDLAIWRLLAKQGYRLVEFLGEDMMFVTREQAQSMPRVGLLRRWKYLRRALRNSRRRAG